MPLQTENRNFSECGISQDKVDYQRFEHTPLDALVFAPDNHSPSIEIGAKFPVSVRIYCPDIRVVSRVACIFEPYYPDDRGQYNLAQLRSEIIAFRAMNAKTRIARVGEIIGKAGTPLQFPKSNIDGIAFQSEDDMPWIDVETSLAFPGVPGAWVFYYHATSNNKLKREEWEGYISRVTMSIQNSPGVVNYGLPS
jgi:hypothetical protein